MGLLPKPWKKRGLHFSHCPVCGWNSWAKARATFCQVGNSERKRAEESGGAGIHALLTFQTYQSESYIYHIAGKRAGHNEGQKDFRKISKKPHNNNKTKQNRQLGRGTLYKVGQQQIPRKDLPPVKVSSYQKNSPKSQRKCQWNWSNWGFMYVHICHNEIHHYV